MYKSKCYDEKHTSSGQTASVQNGYPELAQVINIVDRKCHYYCIKCSLFLTVRVFVPNDVSIKLFGKVCKIIWNARDLELGIQNNNSFTFH